MQDIVLVEGNNELNVEIISIPVITPPPIWPGWGGIYGIVTDKNTGAPLAGAHIAVPGRDTHTGPEGIYALHAWPGSNSVTVTLEGYEPLSLVVTVLLEQNTRLDFELEPIYLPVTIDEFKIKYNYPYIDSVLTITNHSNQTIISQPWPGPLWVGAESDGCVYPGTEWLRDSVINFLWAIQPPDGVLWNGGGPGTMPNVPPGTHSYSYHLDITRQPLSYQQQVLSKIVQGGRGFIHLWFAAYDLGPTPAITIVPKVEVYLEGIFSPEWQVWTPTSWRPPEPPS